MNDLSNLTSFIWWLLLLSSVAIILYDIATAASGRTAASTHPTGKPLVQQREDEISELARQVSRALRRPAGLQVLETQAADTILTAAFAARGMELPKNYHPNSNEVDSLLKDRDIAQFVKAHLTEPRPRAVLKRSQMLAEFQNMIKILDKAGLEFT